MRARRADRAARQAPAIALWVGEEARLVIAFLSSVTSFTSETLGCEPRELLQLFHERGYRLHVIRRNGRLAPVTFEALDGQRVATEEGYLDLLCARATRDASA